MIAYDFFVIDGVLAKCWSSWDFSIVVDLLKPFRFQEQLFFGLVGDYIKMRFLLNSLDFPKFALATLHISASPFAAEFH